MERAPREILDWLGAEDGLFVLELHLIGGTDDLLDQARVVRDILSDLGNVLNCRFLTQPVPPLALVVN